MVEFDHAQSAGDPRTVLLFTTRVTLTKNMTNVWSTSQFTEMNQRDEPAATHIKLPSSDSAHLVLGVSILSKLLFDDKIYIYWRRNGSRAFPDRLCA